MRKGDIVLTPFPFTDLMGNKIRPAIILIESELSTTICFISTQIYFHNEYDFILTPNTSNRLKKESIVKIIKIATIDKNLIIGKIGTLNNHEIQTLNQALKKILKL
ncbi:MAG: type II toxin-antitoxin system PemK/MazF family toxin [Prolixibacteraceae bacterium]|nr:type II toxin-antitoxin system PemK/MazF family toxin [Prolixibacteraceae bacterium]MBN2650667.1 type II toxin-antitoxin system PemK/MazF family toxin [Prolixibacteraceae bacterium]